VSCRLELIDIKKNTPKYKNILLYTMIITKKSMKALNQAVIIDIRADHSRTAFTFSSSIFILLGLITTSKNPTFLNFYSHFSSFTYKLFSSNIFTTFSTTSLYLSSLFLLLHHQ